VLGKLVHLFSGLNSRGDVPDFQFSIHLLIAAYIYSIEMWTASHLLTAGSLRCKM